VAHRVDLFCEDVAHESFARAMLRRLASEEEVEVTPRAASTRFGIPRLKKELTAYQRLLSLTAGLPDVLVILVDANAVGVAARRREVADIVEGSSFPSVVVGVPDPCVERWYLDDPQSFAERFGQVERLPADSPCDEWKRELVDAFERAGEIVITAGAEFAEEIVDGMELYRAGRADHSLRDFVDDLRAAFKRLP